MLGRRGGRRILDALERCGRGGDGEHADLLYLVIDDEEAVLDVVGRFLQIAGHQVVRCSSGQEVLERLNSGHACDLVILDLMMPREDAATTFQRLRQRRPGVPVLLCTGLPDAEPAPSCCAAAPPDCPQAIPHERTVGRRPAGALLEMTEMPLRPGDRTMREALERCPCFSCLSSLLCSQRHRLQHLPGLRVADLL